MKYARGPMRVVGNRTTRKNNNKNKTTNIIYDQNSMSIIKNKITKSSSHQIKTKTQQYLIREDMRPVLNATG